MAKKKTADVDFSMYEKIVALYELQKIDSQIDEINKVKGALPIEVADLEDEIEGLNTRVNNITSEIAELNNLTVQRNGEIEKANAQIAKYTKDQDNVRNNREFDAISKEIEYQELSIKLAEKKLREYANLITIKQENLENAKAILAERSVDLENKRQELDGIEAETEEQSKALKEAAETAKLKIDERLLTAYNKIRSNVRNGLAVVTVQRESCSGCFNRIPPQRQADIRAAKKIIVCEYCGRILVPGDSKQE